MMNMNMKMKPHWHDGMSDADVGCAVIMAMSVSAIVLGPLGFGIGLIFMSFMQSFGIGIVSSITGAIVVGVLATLCLRWLK
jgi:hypothetical protein